MIHAPYLVHGPAVPQRGSKHVNAFARALAADYLCAEQAAGAALGHDLDVHRLPARVVVSPVRPIFRFWNLVIAVPSTPPKLASPPAMLVPAARPLFMVEYAPALLSIGPWLDRF